MAKNEEFSDENMEEIWLEKKKQIKQSEEAGGTPHNPVFSINTSNDVRGCILHLLTLSDKLLSRKILHNGL